MFTHTIRRKMICTLALVLVMLMALSACGISGLLSYRRAVRDLNFSIHEAPRPADLSAAVGLLFRPLGLGLVDSPEAARLQQREFQEHLRRTREEVDEFRWKLEKLGNHPAVLARRPVIETLLRRIDAGLDELEVQQEALADVTWRLHAAQSMRNEVARLVTLTKDVPDHQEGLTRTLLQARRDYNAHLWFFSGTSALALLLFAGLIRYGYVSLFAPLHKLHQGARRVANGDFDYRLTLCSRDEMAELAESFNRMTARFQEIATDLDRQVRERSRQLVRSERLAGIGFLAAGVAHEINNPLSAIAMAAESIEGRIAERLEGAPPEDARVVRQYLGLIQSEAFRCQQITARLLDFSRGQDSSRHRYDLTSIVGEVLALVQHMGKFRDRRIEFARSDPCHLEINGPEIKQVVLNIVANSLESMEPGCTLRIGLAEQTDQVVVTFRDEGCGMTPEVLDNLFEPFFTQRKDGKGTGLGMSISHRIVSDHGGTIEAQSEGPGRGSTFHVRLPRRAAA